MTTQKNCTTKVLVMDLIGKSAKDFVKTLTHFNVSLEFSELQIEQVISNCDKLFSLEDILDNVEMWDVQHAHKILNIISQVFGDITVSSESDDSVSDNDDLLLGEWTVLMEDLI